MLSSEDIDPFMERESSMVGLVSQRSVRPEMVTLGIARIGVPHLALSVVAGLP